MSRIHEIDQTIGKLQAEKQFLCSESNTVPAPTGQTMGMVSEGRAMRERSPEEIIEELFTYHPVQDEAQQLKYGMVRDSAKALALQIWKACPYGRDRTRAIDALRDAVMIANAAIALNGVSLR